jgi:hypothetical protein
MPAAQSLTRNIDRILAYTDEHIVPGIKHIQFKHSVASWIFCAEPINPEDGGAVLQGAGLRMQAGGAKVQINHAIGKNTTAKRMSGAFDTYDTTPQDFVRRSEANWKHYSDTRTISLTDELTNRGEDVVADLVTAETFNAMGSLVELVADDILNGTHADAVTGITSLASASDEVQGLDGDQHAPWNSRGLQARGTVASSVTFASGSFAAQGIDDMRISYNNATQGTRMPTVGLTTFAVHEFYEGSLVIQERYSAPAAMGDAGFRSLQFKQTPVLADELVASGTFLWIDTDTTYVKCLQGAGFEFQPWDRAGQQEARSSELVFKGQVCTEDRRRLNKLTGITA